MLKIGIIVGSTRPGRKADAVARWVHEIAKRRNDASYEKFRVINIAANGPVVMTERVDVFKLRGKSFEMQVMGTFEVRDGKITAWRDYFDMNQFTTRMG